MVVNPMRTYLIASSSALLVILNGCELLLVQRLERWRRRLRR